MNKITLVLIVFFTIASCKKENPNGVNALVVDDYEQAEKDLFKYYLGKSKTNMNEISVREFVSQLKANTEDEDKLDLLVTFGQADSTWVKEDDLSFLISKIKSKEKARCIYRSISSNIPDSKNMTIGNQSISIIEAYRNKEPYPNNTCVCVTYGQNKIKEILIWWKQKNGGGNELKKE